MSRQRMYLFSTFTDTFYKNRHMEGTIFNETIKKTQCKSDGSHAGCRDGTQFCDTGICQ